MKRATSGENTQEVKNSDFNPRPHEEGDEYVKQNGYKALYISIHALMKRATKLLLWNVRITSISIHALMKRATE